jgi:hypothetical protein
MPGNLHVAKSNFPGNLHVNPIIYPLGFLDFATLEFVTLEFVGVPFRLNG